MMELSPVEMLALLPLFSADASNHLARSCCLGLVPCRAFADSATHPTAAVISLRPFGITCAAGDAGHAVALLDKLKGWHPWYELAEPPRAWYPALTAWSAQGYATVRYRFESDPAAFDVARLRALAVPPEGYQVRAYDADLVAQALASPWSEDQIGAFTSPEAFLRDGLGMAVTRDNRLVAGCASFCRHADGFEVQVDTHPEARGKGLATCASAAFILACLRRGQFPYWDAANAKSLRLAEKLGYRFDCAYPAWMLIAPGEDGDAIAQKVIG